MMCYYLNVQFQGQTVNEAYVSEDFKQALIYQSLKLEIYLHFSIFRNVIFFARFHCIIRIYKLMVLKGVYKAFSNVRNT